MQLHTRGAAHVPTHADRLERWLGAEKVAALSQAMRDFYYPIAVHGVPGTVYAMPGGDFRGEIRGGQEASAVERAVEVVRRREKEVRRSRFGRIRGGKELGAFADLSALIAAQTGGKGQQLNFSKTGVAANAIGNSNDLWTRAGFPSAGAAGAAAPGGTAPTSASTGAIRFGNPVNSNLTRFTTAWASASVANNTLLLYDRLFAVAKTMNSVTTEAVTGTFSRYQNTVATADDYAGGSFCFPSNPTTVLANTAHNWTVCQYTNEAGTGTRSFPSIAGVAQCVVGGVDLAVGNWFMPLQAGDVGIQRLTQMQCSAAVATGTIDFVIGHPIVMIPCPIAQLMCILDGINTAFNLQRIYDNACLALLEVNKPATTATNYSGIIQIVAE